jgi:REP element-mobilizing transposase RayT
MADHIRKRHNKNLLIYHIVCPVKFRRDVFSDATSETMKHVCEELGQRYEIRFLEIGIDSNHVHFLIQLVPHQRVSDTVKLIKSITAKRLFAEHPELKKFLWGGNFWTMGYYVNTVGQYGNLAILENYVKKQGLTDYEQIHHETPSLFEQ